MKLDIEVNVNVRFASLAQITEILDVLAQLRNQGNHIMTAISDFAASVAAHQDEIDTAVTGLQGDVKFLTDKIAELQNSTGAISPEDQASLDAIDARVATVATKLQALDALTPPAVQP